MYSLLLAAAMTAGPAERVTATLKTHCLRCHGDAGKGGLSDITDLAALARAGKLEAAHRRMNDGSMPPDRDGPSSQEIAHIRKWIDAGTPGLDLSTQTVSPADVQRIILSDLEAMPPRPRRFQRYFTFAPLSNAGATPEQIQRYGAALAKLINSLSWHPDVRKPVAVAGGTVYRIDLRWYVWDAVLWNRILERYPYGVLGDTAAGRAVSVLTRSRLPAVRGDWFLATASVAPLYYELLDVPASLPELERQLRVDAAVNIRQDRVMRAGFNGSGISKNNRVLERHTSVHGYYWRTYDFEAVPENLVERGELLPDRRNVFAYPLGPGDERGRDSFRHAGGEVIFRLPNGLQGYALVDARDRRIDKGPADIVADPKRPDGRVQAGVSCMGCHNRGIIPKADRVHQFARAQKKVFADRGREIILALYGPADRVLKQMKADAAAFAAACRLCDVDASRPDPILWATLRYEADVDATRAAGEAGVPLAGFRAAVAATPILKANLGTLLTGGRVTRPVWVQAFGDWVRASGGSLFRGNPAFGSLPGNTGDLDPLEDAAATANDAALRPDGRLAILAGGDRSVRVHGVEARRDLRTLVGHSKSVWAVAVSEGGRIAASGGMDRAVKIWDVVNGRLLKSLAGHREVVTAVDVAGGRAVSGGYDGRVVLWDVRQGRAVRELTGTFKYVNAVRFLADGRVAVAADRRLILWDVDRNKVTADWQAHASAVRCVAVDGDQLITGGDDGTAAVWGRDGKLRRRFKGHRGPVLAVALNADRALTGGADGQVRFWRGDSEVRSWGRGRVTVAVAFAGTRQAVSVARDGTAAVHRLSPSGD